MKSPGGDFSATRAFPQYEKKIVATSTWLSIDAVTSIGMPAKSVQHFHHEPDAPGIKDRI